MPPSPRAVLGLGMVPIQYRPEAESFGNLSKSVATLKLARLCS